MQAGSSQHMQELEGVQKKLSSDDPINIQFTSVIYSTVENYKTGNKINKKINQSKFTSLISSYLFEVTTFSGLTECILFLNLNKLQFFSLSVYFVKQFLTVYFIFSSFQGTTGSPKAATLSHFNQINNAHIVGNRAEFNWKVNYYVLPEILLLNRVNTQTGDHLTDNSTTPMRHTVRPL